MTAEETPNPERVPCPACWSRHINRDCQFCLRTEALAKALSPDDGSGGVG